MNYFRVLWGLSSLKRNEKKSAVQLRQLQKRKLREMLVYAYQHSPYYRSAFEAAGLTGETVRTAPLSAFPTLDKAGLLEHFDQLITIPNLTQEELRRFDAEQTADRRPYKGKYHVVHSSGSTGTPGYFLYDEDAWNRMLVGIIRGALWGLSMPQIIKLLARGPRIAYIAATDGRYGGAMAELWRWETESTVWGPDRCTWISRPRWRNGSSSSGHSGPTSSLAIPPPSRFWQNLRTAARWSWRSFA